MVLYTPLKMVLASHSLKKIQFYVNKFSINKLGSGQLFIINYNFLI